MVLDRIGSSSAVTWGIRSLRASTLNRACANRSIGLERLADAGIKGHDAAHRPLLRRGYRSRLQGRRRTRRIRANLRLLMVGRKHAAVESILAWMRVGRWPLGPAQPSRADYSRPAPRPAPFPAAVPLARHPFNAGLLERNGQGSLSSDIPIRDRHARPSVPVENIGLSP